MKNINPDTHIYLYAKGWYKVTDTISDLKKILGKRSNVNPEDIAMNDIISILSEIVYEYKLIRNENDFHRFGIFCEMNGFFEACMREIKLCKITDLNIGEPDYTVLPANILIDT